MPTYEYACRDCGEHVEVVQSFKDDPLTTCGVCGGTLRKVFSAAGIIFKGSGYYVTDSRQGAATGSGSSSSSKQDSKESGGTDAAGKDSGSKGSGSKGSGSGDSSSKSGGKSSDKGSSSTRTAESA